MYEENTAIDIVNLAEKLGESLKDVGRISYITDILNANVTTVNIKKHGEIVKEKANNRKVLEILKTFMEKIQKGEGSSESVINYTQNALLSVKNAEVNEDGSMEKILHYFMDTLKLLSLT